jgi:hypothetical protein
VAVYRVRLEGACEGGNKHEETIKFIKLLEKLSD